MMDENNRKIASELSEIIKSLCDWIKDTKLVIRHLGVYSQLGGVYVELSFVKSVAGEDVVLTRSFYVGGVLGSRAWDAYSNELKLAYMIEEFSQCNTLPKGRWNGDV